MRPSRAGLVVLSGGPLDQVRANMRCWELDGVMTVHGHAGRYVLDRVRGEWFWETESGEVPDRSAPTG